MLHAAFAAQRDYAATQFSLHSPVGLTEAHAPDRNVRERAREAIVGLPTNAASLAAFLVNKLLHCAWGLGEPGRRAIALAQILILLLVLCAGGAMALGVTAAELAPVKEFAQSVGRKIAQRFCPNVLLGEWYYEAKGADGSSWGGKMHLVQLGGKYDNAFKAVGERQWIVTKNGEHKCLGDLWESEPAAYLDEQILYHYDLKYKHVKGFVRMSATDLPKTATFHGEFYESVRGELADGEMTISHTSSSPCPAKTASN